MKSLFENCKIVSLLAPTTAATGASTGDSVDTAGFTGCLFVGALGTQGATATCSLAIHQSSASTSGFDALTGMTHTSTAGESDKVQVIDVYKPEKRYLRPVLTRGSTDTTEYGGITAILYGPSDVPTTHSSTSLSGSTGILGVSPTT